MQCRPNRFDGIIHRTHYQVGYLKNSARKAETVCMPQYYQGVSEIKIIVCFVNQPYGEGFGL